jgi:hypothetical protein
LNLVNKVCSSFDSALVVPRQLCARTLSTSPISSCPRRTGLMRATRKASTGESSLALNFLFAIEQYDDQRAVDQLHAP